MDIRPISIAGAALLLAGCMTAETHPTARLAIDGVDAEASQTHFGGRNDATAEIRIEPNETLLLAGEGFEWMKIHVDLTAVPDDQPEVYDIHLESICGENAWLEMSWGGDHLQSDPTQALPNGACALVSGGETAGFVSGLVHFHSIDGEKADLTLSMSLTFTDPAFPTLGVSHDLDVSSLEIDFDSIY